MLNLNSMPHTSDGELVRVFPTRSSEDKGLIWDWDFAYSIDAENLPAIEQVFAGVGSMITNAESAGTSTTLRDTTEREPVHLTITSPDTDGKPETLFHGKAEIRFVRLVINGKVACATIRFRTRGLAENAASLVAQLGDYVSTSIEPMQQSLPFDSESPEAMKTEEKPKAKKAKKSIALVPPEA